MTKKKKQKDDGNKSYIVISNIWDYYDAFPWIWDEDYVNIDTTDASGGYYINWLPLEDDKKIRCPICGKWVFGLLKDKQGNEMCIGCYKEIYGSDC